MKNEVCIGRVKIGGNNKIAIQSMTNTPTLNYKATLKQINALSQAGADLVRIALPCKDSINVLDYILPNVSLPIIGDFHFDYKLAIAGIEKGLDKIRINPGNISKSGIKEIVKAAKERNTPIRVGINKGSIKERNPSPKRLAELTMNSCKLIEDLGYSNLVLAVKSSNVGETVQAYTELHKLTNHPLHIGLTESGFGAFAQIKSSIAIGSLLLNGIGDTIRVSLAGDPIKEIIAAKDILKATGIDNNFAQIIACPTCGRCELDIENLAKAVHNMVCHINKPLKIAVMGCIVNGIGEGKDADIGIACGREKSILFSKGEVLKTVDNTIILSELNNLLEKYDGCDQKKIY